MFMNRTSSVALLSSILPAAAILGAKLANRNKYSLGTTFVVAIVVPEFQMLVILNGSLPKFLMALFIDDFDLRDTRLNVLTS